MNSFEVALIFLPFNSINFCLLEVDICGKGTNKANGVEDPETGIASPDGTDGAEGPDIGTAEADGAEDPDTGIAIVDEADETNRMEDLDTGTASGDRADRAGKAKDPVLGTGGADGADGADKAEDSARAIAEKARRRPQTD